ncbi:MAG TPA: trypsin-like peptidase domain-containing protein [Acidimicrobiia bacterium]|nr:trypsin-like peptidase domain-containing protein [Acidimicrobiia bacterium]
MPDEAVPPSDVLTVPPSPPPAWSQEPPTTPPWPTPPGPPAPPPERKNRLRQFLVGALVGGLCGALVASGAFFAFGRDDNSSSPAPPATKTQEVARGSSTIGGNGDVAGIIAKVEPAVVAVTVNSSQGQAAGTGFFLSSDGYLVTNAHVVSGAQTAKLQLNDGRTLDANVVGRDSSADVAVLKVNADNLPVVCTDDSNKVQVGDDVVAIGNALALKGGLSVTRGIISGPPRPGSEIGSAIENVLQTDAAINPGNSGGPLADSNGCVIGINTAVASGTGQQPAQNIGFAIPITPAKSVVDDIKAGRKPAFLGVGTDDMTPELKGQLGVNVDSGAVVADVTPGSPADDGGLQRGDVIVQIGDDQIKSSGDIATAVRKHQPNQKVTVTFVRGSDRKTAQVTLVARPDAG